MGSWRLQGRAGFTLEIALASVPVFIALLGTRSYAVLRGALALFVASVSAAILYVMVFL